MLTKNYVLSKKNYKDYIKTTFYDKLFYALIIFVNLYLNYDRINIVCVQIWWCGATVLQCFLSTFLHHLRPCLLPVHIHIAWLWP